MPTTVTASNAVSYHLFQLPLLSSKETTESIQFAQLQNDLGNGYESQVLFGATAGLRSWKLNFATLASLEVLPNTVTSINGETVSREQYIWDLFCEWKASNTPFAYQSPRDGAYYLVRFVDEELSYQRMRVKLYSAGIELRQLRIQGLATF